MSTGLTVYDGDRSAHASELHSTIERFAIAYAEAGRAMIEMRDGQFYRDLPGYHYATFEEYVGAVRELTVRHAQRLIRASLIHACLTKDGATKLVAPSYGQCQTLDNGKGAVRMKTRKVPREDGHGFIEQPVAVANADELRSLWSSIVDAYQQQVERDKQERPDKPPRKFTASFVNEHLPNKYRNDAIVKARTAKVYARVISKINRLVEQIEQLSLHTFDGQKKLSITDEWSKDDRAQFADALREAKQLIDGAVEAIARIRV